MFKRFRSANKLTFSPATASLYPKINKIAGPDDLSSLSPEEKQEVTDNNILPADYSYARKECKVPHADIIDAQKMDREAGGPPFYSNGPFMIIGGDDNKSTPRAHSRFMLNYATARYRGATHEEIKDAYSQGFNDLHAYTRARNPSGNYGSTPEVSHKDAMDQFKNNPGSIKALKEPSSLTKAETLDKLVHWDEDKTNELESDIQKMRSRSITTTPEEHERFIRQSIANKHEIDFYYQGKLDPRPYARTVIPTNIDRSNPFIPRMEAYDPVGQMYKHYNISKTRMIGIFDSRPRHQEPPAYVPDYEQPNPEGGQAPRQFYHPERPWEQNDANRVWSAEGFEPWASKADKLVPRTHAVEPTKEEYEEAKSKDIDPDTFDKATYKRVRNLGASHNDCIDAMSSGIPIEDYETTYKHHVDKDNPADRHTLAKDEALKMEDNYYSPLRSKNRIFLNVHARDLTNLKLLNDDQRKFQIQKLINHHTTLKNLPTLPPQNKVEYANTPWRRRANQWMVHDLTKLDSSFNPLMAKIPAELNGKKRYDENQILSVDEHDKIISNLIRHTNIDLMNSNTKKEQVSNMRKLNVLNHAANAQFIPNDYEYDKYEE